MKTYKIYELYASAWRYAIENFATIVNIELGTNYFVARDWHRLEELAEKLGINFDQNGEIIKN